MKTLFRKIWYLIDHFDDVVVIVSMLGIAIAVSFSVFTRFVFNLSISGSDEVATSLFIWAALFGAAAGFRYDKHGSVPIIVNLLPRRARHVADLTVLLVMAGFFFFLAWYAALFVRQSARIGQISPATGLPVWVINAGILVALALCGLRCLMAVIRDLSGRDRFPKAPDMPE